MNYFNWLEQEKLLTNAALTVRAQAIPPNDNGRLKWDIFFPRRDVPSVDLHEITTINFRPVAERREWNAPSKKIVLKTPNLRDISMIPIESAHSIEEYELQKLAERAFGPNTPVFRQILTADIPDRVVFLTQANWRKVEVDDFGAWATGTTVVRNPLNPATSYTVSFGFAAARYQVAGTAFNVTTNAYNDFLLWLRSVATTLVNGFQGVMIRQATLNEIVADAPNPFSYNATVQPTIDQVEQRITQTLGTPFRFVVNEDTVDQFTGGGQATAPVKVWPTGRIAIIPAGDGVVGNTAAAPVVRAMQIAGGAPSGANIDINGMTAYRESMNNGRGLVIEVQGNLLGVPNEQQVAVLNAGV
jgi:hypothetical protein